MIDRKELFLALNERLKTENIDLTVICAGGFVLDYYGIRATQDVDAFYDESEKIRKLIYEVGEEFQANKADELWLNNAVMTMNPTPPDEICQTIDDFSHLTVKMVPPEYVIGMKLESQREQDFLDVGSLIKLLKEKSPFDLLMRLKKQGFKTDISLMLEGFSEAYGFEWLEDFIKNNEDELRKYY